MESIALKVTIWEKNFRECSIDFPSGYEMRAFRPVSTAPGNFLFVALGESQHKPGTFATWLVNGSDKGCFNGHYDLNGVTALADFNGRG